MYFVTKAAALLMMAMTASAKAPALRGITQDIQEEFDSFVEVMEKNKDKKDLLAAYADVLDYYMYPEDSEDFDSEDFDSEDYEFEEKKKKGGKGGRGGGGNMGCAHGYKFRRGAGCVYEGGRGGGGHHTHAPYYGGRGGNCWAYNYDGKECKRQGCTWRAHGHRVSAYAPKGTCTP